MKRPADLVDTFVFDHEDLAVAVDIPEPESAEKDLGPKELEGTTAIESSIGAAGPSVGAVTPAVVLQAERIKQLEAELRLTRGANETLKAQLQAALNIGPSTTSSWFACA